MTKGELENYKLVLPGKKPFAGDADVTFPSTTSSSGFTMPDGFGPSFDAAPESDGSNMVQRGQMNFIGRMASFAPFLFQAGGYYSFDPDVCMSIGGYPRGAVLTMVAGNSYLKVESLQDNNTVDFRGMTDTAEFPGVTNGTVDNVNWRFLNLDPQTIIDQSVVAEIHPFTFAQKLKSNVSAFKASRDSALVVEGGIDVEVEEKEEEHGIRKVLWDVTLVLSPAFETLDLLGGWTPNETTDTRIYTTGTNVVETKQGIVKEDNYYGIGLVGTSWAPTGSVVDDWSLWVKVLSSTIKVRMLAI